DAGCGFGRLGDAYIDRFDEVVLFDGAWSLLERARERWGGRATLVAGDLHALPFAPRTFDAIVSVRVLHHMERPARTLAALREVTATGGRLVCNVSNKRNLKRIVAWSIGRTDDDPFAPGMVAYGDASFGMHPSDLERLCSTAGFLPLAWRGVGVADKLAKYAGPFAPLVPSGATLARALGRVRYAPSLFVAACAGAPGLPTTRPGSIERLLRCPRCRCRLGADEGGWRCVMCRTPYPVRDGIHDLRP
ncbi:MAG: methyltransferase domain-containing protein, partial [Actinomycetota bacterium]